MKKRVSETIVVDDVCACEHHRAAHTRRVDLRGGRVSDYGCVSCKCRRFRSTAHGSDREAKSEALRMLRAVIREAVSEARRGKGKTVHLVDWRGVVMCDPTLSDQLGDGEWTRSVGLETCDACRAKADSVAAQDVREEFEHLSHWSVTALRGLARRLEVDDFDDLKSENDLISAIMSAKFGDDWEKAFLSEAADRERPTGPASPVGKHGQPCGGNVYKVRGQLYCSGCGGKPDKSRGRLRWL